MIKKKVEKDNPIKNNAMIGTLVSLHKAISIIIVLGWANVTMALIIEYSCRPNLFPAFPGQVFQNQQTREPGFRPRLLLCYYSKPGL